MNTVHATYTIIPIFPHPYLAEDQNMENEGITMHVPAGRKEVFENSHSYSHFTIVDDLPEQKMNCIDFGYHGDRFQEEGIGTNGPAAEGAILIPTAQLRAYEGMQITGVNFDNSFFTIRICVYRQTFYRGENRIPAIDPD